MTTYGITSITGRFGQFALKELLKTIPADHIVGFARDIQKGQKMVPAGVTVRFGDFTQPETLTQAFQGIDRLLFISSIPGQQVSRGQQHQNVVQAAKQAQVARIVYTSFPHANTATTPLAADHWATEQAITATGISHSFLRNNWYLENQLNFIKAGVAKEPLLDATDHATVGWALEQEYAIGAAKVLQMEQPKTIYEFSGPAKTFADLAQALPNQPQIQSVTLDQMRQNLTDSGLRTGAIESVIMSQTLIRDRQLAQTANDLAEVLGHPLTPLAEAIEQLLKQ
ncbi:NAD(P)H-binding protein [Weissella kandleri]|uniref:NAD(P)H-binding protein n=1 Tax=Weissella kandleri TaxID=1616 RepID=UPI00387E5B7A